MIELTKTSSGGKAPIFLSIHDFVQLDQAEFLHDVADNIHSTSRKPTYRLDEFSQISFLIRDEKRIPGCVIACCRLFFSNQNTRPVREILGELLASSCGFTPYHLHLLQSCCFFLMHHYCLQALSYEKGRA